jgi:hypothetical protein
MGMLIRCESWSLSVKARGKRKGQALYCFFQALCLSFPSKVHRTTPTYLLHTDLGADQKVGN